MKNILNYKVMAVALSVGLFSSCNDDNESYTKSVKSIVSTEQTNVTIVEGESATVTLTINTPYQDKSDLKIELVGGTGSYEDFSVDYGTFVPLDLETTTSDGWGLIGYKLAFPAYSSTFTFNINAVLDLLPESTETLKLKLSTAGNGNALVASTSEYINVTITPTVLNDFYTKLEWNGDHKDPHGTIIPTTYIGTDDKSYETCRFDFDLEIYDAGFNPVADSYNNCPEEITLDAATTPDGDYIIVPSFYTRTVGTLNSVAEIAGRPKSGEIIYPVKLTMSKPGAFSHTVDMTGTFKYSVGGAVQGNPDAYVPVAYITKTGNTYVLKDYNTDDVIAQGRMQAFVNAIKNRNKSKK